MSISLSGYEYIDIASVYIDFTTTLPAVRVTPYESVTMPILASKRADLMVVKAVHIGTPTVAYTATVNVYSNLIEPNRAITTIPSAATTLLDYYPNTVYRINKDVSGVRFDFWLRFANGDSLPLADYDDATVLFFLEFYKKKNVDNVIG